MSGQPDTYLAIGDDPTQDQWLRVVIRDEAGRDMWVALNPESAVDVAEELARRAYEKRYGKPSDSISTLKDEVINRKRVLLMNRCKIVIPQLLEQKKSNEHIAATIIDLVLAEVA